MCFVSNVMWFDFSQGDLSQMEDGVTRLRGEEGGIGRAPLPTRKPRSGRMFRYGRTCRGLRSRGCGGCSFLAASSLLASARPRLRGAAASPPHALLRRSSSQYRLRPLQGRGGRGYVLPRKTSCLRWYDIDALEQVFYHIESSCQVLTAMSFYLMRRLVAHGSETVKNLRSGRVQVPNLDQAIDSLLQVVAWRSSFLAYNLHQGANPNPGKHIHVIAQCFASLSVHQFNRMW